MRVAVTARRQWLVEQDLATEDDGVFRLRANAISVLQRRELLRVAARLEDELGRRLAGARSGDAIEGRLVRAIEAASGRYALVEKSREFTLVPWRSVLDTRLGKNVDGVMRGDNGDWRLGRRRSGPEIC